jgi:hypothetical protein
VGRSSHIDTRSRNARVDFSAIRPAGEVNFWQWLEIEKTMLLQMFLPVHHPVTQTGLNSDFGAIDKLRAWDLMRLAKGNLALLFLAVSAA